MKSLTKKILILCFFILSSSLYAEKVGDIFNVTVKSDTEINVKSKSMTYYFMRLVSEDNERSAPVLIQRNNKKVKYDIGDKNITWNGIIPTVKYKAPNQWISFNEKNTSFNPSTKLKKWRNSSIEFQGGNILDISDSWKVDKASAIGLMILNSTVVLSLAADTAIGFKDTAIVPKVVSSLDKLKLLGDIPANMKKINFYYTLNSVSLDLADKLLSLSSDNQELHDAVVQVRDEFAYVDELIKNVANATGALKINEEQKKEYFKSISAAYAKRTKQATMNNIDAFEKDIIEKYNAVKENDVDKAKKKKLNIVLGLFLGSINEGIVAYQSSLSKAELKKQRSSLQIAKLVVGIFSFTNSIFADDMKTDYKKGLDVLTDTSIAAVGYLSTEIVSDEKLRGAAVNAMMDGRTKKALLLKNSMKFADKALKRIKVGSVIGNQLIPFLYDFTMSKNVFNASIVDGKVSMYGYPKNKFEIYDSMGNQIINTSLVSNDHPIYTKPSEDLHAKLFVNQNDLFDNPNKSPWEINDYVVPSTLYEIILSANNKIIKNGVCVKKTYFSDPVFSVYSHADNKIVQCHKDEMYTPSIGVAQYDTKTIPENRKINSLDNTIAELDFNSGTLTNQLYIAITGYPNALKSYSLNFIDISNAKITHMLSDDLISTLRFYVDFAPGDEIIDVLWDFGDGTTKKTSTLETSHSYDVSDNFTVSVIVRTKLGGIIRYSQIINSSHDTLDTTAPIFKTGSAATADVNENQIAAITLDATDETSSVTYSISGADATYFTVNTTTGVVTFKNAPDYEATPTKTSYVFVATAKDDALNESTQNVTINVLDVDEVEQNEAPVASPLSISIKQDSIENPITLNGQDKDGDTLTYIVVTKPLNGSLSGSGKNLLYTPITGYNGNDSFTYKVNDGKIDSEIETVSIIITTTQKPSKSIIKKTGQTKSYDVDGIEVTDNSLKDDGYYQKGVIPDYTRASEIVTDELTGLMWQDNVDVTSITKQWLTDANYDTCSHDRSSPACYDTSGDTAATYCTDLTLGGYTDWRLPTRKELKDIIDYSKNTPAISSVFTNTISSLSWSSTTDENFKEFAWAVNFYDGQVSHDAKGVNNRVRCVRDGQ